MKKQLHFYIIILTLGLFLLPTLTYACGNKSEKSCCKTETSSKKEMKECCKKQKDTEEKTPCGGKCGHSNCTTSTSSYSAVLFNELVLTRILFDFSTEKQKFHHYETTTSNGFTSVWLIPKIG